MLRHVPLGEKDEAEEEELVDAILIDTLEDAIEANDEEVGFSILENRRLLNMIKCLILRSRLWEYVVSVIIVILYASDLLPPHGNFTAVCSDAGQMHSTRGVAVLYERGDGKLSQYKIRDHLTLSWLNLKNHLRT